MRHAPSKQVTSLAAAFSVTIAVGCQSFAPGSVASRTSPREESRILKQAENDPFPSPADVGLEKPAAKP